MQCNDILDDADMVSQCEDTLAGRVCALELGAARCDGCADTLHLPSTP